MDSLSTAFDSADTNRFQSGGEGWGEGASIPARLSACRRLLPNVNFSRRLNVHGRGKTSLTAPVATAR